MKYKDEQQIPKSGLRLWRASRPFHAKTTKKSFAFCICLFHDSEICTVGVKKKKVKLMAPWHKLKKQNLKSDPPLGSRKNVNFIKS